MFPSAHVVLACCSSTLTMTKVADVLNLRNRHSAIFLLSTDLGRMLDHISIGLIHQADPVLVLVVSAE